MQSATAVVQLEEKASRNIFEVRMQKKNNKNRICIF